MASHSKNNEQATVSLDALRGQAMKRLSGIQQRLENKGVGAAFIKSARPDPIGDMGFMGSLVMDMILGGAFSSFLGAGMTDAFNCVSAVAGLEGVAALTDETAHSYRGRKLSDYPEGRRRCALEAARVGKKFNLVSPKQTSHFSYNAQADLACMFEILDMLDKLESEGVSMIRLDPQEPVYTVLKGATTSLFRKGAVRNYSTPMCRSV